MVDRVLADVKFAARALRRVPLLFVTAVLTLAAGIGIATGIFAVTYGVLLRPLPYADPDRLVLITLHTRGPAGQDGGIRLDEFEEWRRRVRAFDALAAHGRGEFTVRGAGDPRVVRGAVVTDGFFETLGVRALEGSTNEITRGARTAAFSARLSRQLENLGGWRERGLTIGAGDFRVVAVMPPAFVFPADEVDLWMNAEAVPGVTLFGSADQRRFRLIGRLAPGITIQQATDDVQRVAREIDAGATPPRSRDAAVVRMVDRQRQDARPSVLPFLAGAALVLLIACANVSGLLVGRSVGRQGEFAVRRALGGGAADVLRASLAESFIVTLCGWALGLWFATVVVQVFEALAQGAVSNLHMVRLDAPVLLASLALAILVALVSGGAPAVRALRANPNTALKSGSTRTSRERRSIGGVLVIGQIAMTVVLLVAAGLLMRTVVRIVSAERGFRAEDALTLRLMLTQTTAFEANDRAPFINRLVSELRGIPGVTAAGVGSDLPPAGTQISMTIKIVTDTRTDVFDLSYAAAAPGYLEALGATVVAGRLFEDRDRLSDVPPAVVTESAARLMFQGRDAVGREWPAPLVGPTKTRVRPRVIGVIKDIKYGGLDRAAPATLFAPWEKLAPGTAHLVIRTTRPVAEMAPAIRRTVVQLDPTLPLRPVQTLDEVISESIAPRRLRLQLAAAFALLALALASVALWGAVAQSVLDRRRELAVRLALGATHRDAVRLMVRRGVAFVAVGILIGAGAGALAARTLRHLLHEVSAADPVSFALAIGIAAVVSLVACYVPARRAASISPAELLREA